MSRFDDINYENDRRVVARSEAQKRRFDEKAMTLTFAVCDENGEEEDIAFPAKYEVCTCCEGRGSHVNPSIDSSGISRDAFDEDPDFEAAYHEGAYDVTCGGCDGRRVEPTIDEARLDKDQRAAYNRVLEMQEDERATRAAVRMERMMGA